MIPGDAMKKILSRYRDPRLAKKAIEKIWELARDLPAIRIMHVCGVEYCSPALLGYQDVAEDCEQGRVVDPGGETRNLNAMEGK